MLRLAYPPFATGRTALALLLLRLMFGVAMTLHGWKKIQDPLHWMDGSEHAASAPLQALAAISEFGGGLALALGLLTPLACLGIAATMSFAIYTHVDRGHAFVGKPSWELAGLHLAVAVGLLLAGPGRWSVDFALLGRRRGEAPPA
jgi:putative oxidoreductase